MTLKGVVVRGGDWGTGTKVGISLGVGLLSPAPGGLCPRTHEPLQNIPLPFILRVCC